MQYKIRFSVKALQDFKEIYDYIALDNPSIAESYTNELRERIKHLADFPYMGKENATGEYRRIIKKPYIIRYAVNEQAKTVEIIFIRHEAQEPYED